MAIAINPVLAREVKERMRGRRAPIVITLYLVLLTLGLWLVYEAASHADAGSPLPTQLAQIGSTVFEWVLFFMLLLLMFLVPAQTAGAIAGERERQTLVPLQITLLSPRSILLGKVCAAMAFLALLVVATVPLMSIAYLIGGVEVGQVLGGTALVLATGVCVGAICASISTFMKRVQSATVMSYGFTLFLLIGTLLAYGGAVVVDESRGIDEGDPPAALIALNPVAIVGDLVGNHRIDESSPFDAIKGITDPEDRVDQFNARAVDFEVVGGEAPPVLLPDGGFVGDAFDVGGLPGADEDGDDGVPFWLGSLLALMALAALSVALAARRLRTPAERER
jgi:ABC-2 type transport system permease protein